LTEKVPLIWQLNMKEKRCCLYFIHKKEFDNKDFFQIFFIVVYGGILFFHYFPDHE